jgi:phosphatidylglycerol:prolipoprotein diacylglycerol transferase
VTGVFAIGYGLARITCEFFREPDPQLGFLFGGATMGMLLSLPLIAVGLALVAMAQRRRKAAS